MYVYIYMYVHTYTYIYACMSMYICTHVSVYRERDGQTDR